MPSTILGKALLAGCALILGGCQVAGTPGLSRTGTAAEQRPARTETEQGREHLSAQRNGLAIEAFNRALVFGEEPAPALNGLGVAYARLAAPTWPIAFSAKQRRPIRPAQSIRAIWLC